MDVTKAAEGITRGTIDASQLGTQTAGSQSGWFTKSLTSSQKSAQDLVTKTINDSYADTLSGYSKDAMRFFSDVKNKL